MLINNLKLSILGAIAVFFMCNIASAACFNIKNNTYAWNIKYRFKPAMAPETGDEKILKPGEVVNSDSNTISIRRSGTGSTVLSGWTDVPLHDLLVKSGRLGRMYGCLNIDISTGLSTSGWSFNPR